MLMHVNDSQHPQSEATHHRSAFGWHQWLAILIALSMLVAAVICAMKQAFLLAALALITSTTALHTVIQIVRLELQQQMQSDTDTNG